MDTAMKKHPVLILSGNDRIATSLLHAIDTREFDTYVAASEPYAHALYLVADSRRVSLRRSDDPRFLLDLLRQCVDLDIRVVIPSSDRELLALADARPQFQRNGIEILLTSTAGLKICMDRQRLLESCRDVVRTPLCSPIDDHFRTSDWRFPVLVRHRYREDGDEIGIAKNPAELDRIGWGEDLIAQHYLGGERYFVEALIGEDGTPVLTVPIVELRSRSSDSTAYRTIQDPELQELALRVIRFLCLTHGVSLRFQRDRDDVLHLTDIAPRFSKALPLVVAAGFNPVTASLRGLVGAQEKHGPVELADIAMIPGSDPLFLPSEEIERLEDVFFRARIEREG